MNILRHLRGARRALPVILAWPLSVACGSGDTTSTAGSGGFQITVSGEDLALLGYDFGAGALADGDPPAFVDGWALRFEHVIISVGAVRLNAEPDRDAGNPFDTGAQVAERQGPWAVDVALGGDITGKSGSPDERTVEIARLETRDDGGDFDPAARYAFSYDLVPASATAEPVNLDPDGLALYAEAQQRGWSMIFAGTARYQGPTPEAGSVFATLPGEVAFTLGMTNPTSYVNCRNTDLQQVEGEFPRGVQARAGSPTVVQLTLHTDHAFWDTLNVEGTPLHFDPIAAQAVAGDNTPARVTLDDLALADITAFRTRAGTVLPWRSLVPDYTAPPGQMSYDANGTSFGVPNSLAAYLSYSAASGGHMNADGECEIRNDFTP